MSANVLNLPLDLYSPDQLGILLMESGKQSNALRDEGVRSKAASKDTEPSTPHISALMTSILHDNGLKSNDQKSFEKLSTGLRVIRDKAPIAHITLAALPNRSLKRQLVEWFRAEINPYMLLTFAVRADIGGGVVFRVGSRVYDYSFRQQIMSNKHRLSEIYENVR